ncbi:MAG: ASCH domain-containing protein [Acidimicrobiia bacterium]
MDPDTMWTDYVAATGADGPYTAEAFAEGLPEVSTELALLVRDGPKRATASVLALWEEEGESLPVPGAHSVVLDGTGQAVCVIRTASVETRRFGDVDDTFAWDEGEGDRTLAWWRQAHVDFFAGIGTTITDDTVMVLERFELVWPP